MDDKEHDGTIEVFSYKTLQPAQFPPDPRHPMELRGAKAKGSRTKQKAKDKEAQAEMRGSIKAPNDIEDKSIARDPQPSQYRTPGDIKRAQEYESEYEDGEDDLFDSDENLVSAIQLEDDEEDDKEEGESKKTDGNQKWRKTEESG